MNFGTEFDYRKATQSVNFLIRQYNLRKLNKMKAIKLIWLADRYHLRMYGRTITGDEYMAMPYGPVASSVKDILEKTDFLSLEEKGYSDQYIVRLGVNLLESIKEVDTNVLSETDIEALNFAYKNFGQLTQFDLAELSHKYPEWSRYKTELESRSSTREKMYYQDFFNDPENFNSDLFKTDRQILDCSKEIFLENENAELVLG